MYYPRPILQDMPFHIKKIITDLADIESRFSLRNTCKELRQIIDNSSIFYKEVRLDVIAGDKFLLTAKKGRSGETAQLVSASVSRILNHLEVILKNPNAHFDQFAFNQGVVDALEPFKILLTSLQYRLSVEYLVLDVLLDEEDLLTLLPCFEPETLTSINLGNLLEEDMSRVAELEQWKQAKEAMLDGCTLFIDKLLHFQNLGLYGEYYLFPGHVETILTHAIRHGNNFKCWEIYQVEMDEEIYEVFGEEALIEVPHCDHRLRLFCEQDKFRLESTKYYGEASSDEEDM